MLIKKYQYLLLGFIFVLSGMFAFSLFSTNVYASDTYKDCEKIDNNKKKEKCEDEVYDKLLKECIGGSTNDSKIESCKSSVKQQPYKDNQEPTRPDNKPSEASQSYNCSDKTKEECLDQNPIMVWLKLLINIFMGVIGVAAVLMITVGGIQYITARDNAQAVASAKQRIINVVIGLVAFMFLYAFLQWLIPGGIFTN
jgi:hypothetical protein